MVRFEQRFGGIGYKLLVGNPMTYGLRVKRHGPRRGPTAYLTEQGWAFAGIVDGDLTWGLDVLVDGRVAVDYGEPIAYRVLNRNVEQRLQSDALLAELRHRPHRSFEFRVANKVTPSIPDAGLPPVLPEASGEGALWWGGGESAFFARLHSWIYDGMDSWQLWAFAVQPSAVQDVRDLVAFRALQPVESTWCHLCGEPTTAGETCTQAPGKSA